MPKDAADVGEKSHVEHAVRFVEHQVLETAQLGVRPREMVQQATRRVWWQAAAALALLGIGEAVAQAIRGVRFTDHTDYPGIAAASRLFQSSARSLLPAMSPASTGSFASRE